MKDKSNENIEEYFCSECGKNVAEKDKYCSNCGADLSTEVIDENNDKIYSENINQFGKSSGMLKMELTMKGVEGYLPILLIPFFLIGGSFFVINAFKSDEVFQQIFSLVWMGIVLFNAKRFVKMITRISILSDDQIVFKTILGKDYKIYPHDFISIKIKNSITQFATKEGKFVSYGNFNGFSDFVVLIKKLNPGFITEGC